MTETLLRRPAGDAALAVPRRAKIVCTIGPATASPERISELVGAGMDVARLNFSHGHHALHAEAYGDIRAASDAAGRAVGVLADLQGPKLRISWLAGGVAFLAGGARVVVTADPDADEEQGTADRLFTTYAALPDDVRPGDTILLA